MKLRIIPQQTRMFVARCRPSVATIIRATDDYVATASARSHDIERLVMDKKRLPELAGKLTARLPRFAMVV